MDFRGINKTYEEIQEIKEHLRAGNKSTEIPLSSGRKIKDIHLYKEIQNDTTYYGLAKRLQTKYRPCLAEDGSPENPNKTHDILMLNSKSLCAQTGSKNREKTKTHLVDSFDFIIKPWVDRNWNAIKKGKVQEFVPFALEEISVGHRTILQLIQESRDEASTHRDDILEVIDKKGDDILEVVAKKGDDVIDVIDEVGNEVKEEVKEVKQVVKEQGDEVKEVVRDGIDKLCDVITSQFSSKESSSKESKSKLNTDLSTKKSCLRYRKNAKVSFGPIVRVRHYRMELGDSPACREGPPLQLEWKPFRTSNALIQDRCGCPKYLLPDYRRSILLQLGYSEEDVDAASSRAPKEPDEDEELADKYQAYLNKQANKMARRFKLQESEWAFRLNPKNLAKTLAKRRADNEEETGE